MDFTVISGFRPEPLSLLIALPLMATAVALVCGSARLAYLVRRNPDENPFPLAGPTPDGVRPTFARLKMLASWLGYFVATVLVVIASSGRVPWW